MVYPNQSFEQAKSSQSGSEDLPLKQFKKAVLDGAVLRVRPVLMTTGATIVGLLPIMWSDGTCSEVMQRLAAPMVCEMISALALTLLVLPAVYFLFFKPKR